MEQNRGFRALAIVALCISVIGLSIGFAAFSQTLTINGTGTLKGNTWKVIFDDLVTPTIGNGNLVGDTTSTEAINVAGTTFTFNVELFFPGDKVVYDFKVKNTGTIDAKITAVSLTGVTDAAAKKINYTLTYADGTAIAQNDVLNAGDDEDLKLTVEFDSSATSADLPTTDWAFTLGATITYEQIS